MALFYAHTCKGTGQISLEYGTIDRGLRHFLKKKNRGRRAIFTHFYDRFLNIKLLLLLSHFCSLCGELCVCVKGPVKIYRVHWPGIGKNLSPFFSCVLFFSNETLLSLPSLFLPKTALHRVENRVFFIVMEHNQVF